MSDPAYDQSQMQPQIDPQTGQPYPADPAHAAGQPAAQPQYDPATMGSPIDPAMMQPPAADPQAQFAPPPLDPSMAQAPPMAPGMVPDPSQYADPNSYPAVAPQYYQEDQQQAYAAPEEDLSNIRPVPRVAIQAFCETESVSNVIDYASRDRRMTKAHVKVQMGGVAAAVDFYQTATTPNLILVESKLIGEALINELEKLADVCDEGTNVVVIGHKNDVQLYRDLISRGVAEYLVAPVNMADIMDIVTTLFVNPDAAPLGNTISFVGAKGGVGSSTIAHNVAWAISSNFESGVILADLDLAFGTANIDFDQDPAQGMAEAVFSSDKIDETYLDRLLAKCTDHLSLLAAPSTLDREYDFDANDFNSVLEIAQRGTPNVIVDLPHVWTGWAKQVLSISDKVVITATPDLACLRNTKNLIDTLAELRPNDEKPYLILNQCNVAKRPEISIEDFTQPLGIQPTSVLSFEPALFGLAANNGQMISEADPKSEVAAAIDHLANVLTGRRTIEPIQKKSLSSMLSRFSRKKEKK